MLSSCKCAGRYCHRCRHVARYTGHLPSMYVEEIDVEIAGVVFVAEGTFIIIDLFGSGTEYAL